MKKIGSLVLLILAGCAAQEKYDSSPIVKAPVKTPANYRMELVDSIKQQERYQFLRKHEDYLQSLLLFSEDGTFNTLDAKLNGFSQEAKLTPTNLAMELNSLISHYELIGAQEDVSRATYALYGLKSNMKFRDVADVLTSSVSLAQR